MGIQKNKLRLGIVLIIGILIGYAWHKLYLFPLPQLHNLKVKTQKKRLAESELALPGRWRMIDNPDEANENLTVEQKKMIKQLESIGYLSGSQPVPKRIGITIFDKKKAWHGLNLVVSGHGPEALLTDMEGNELHKWHCTMKQAWPEYKPSAPSPRFTCWRRAHLMENGDLLAIFEGVGILRLDKNSNLLWSKRNGAHHDLYVTNNGNIYVLTRKSHINPKYNDKKPILEDFITILDAEGNLLDEYPILEKLENTRFAPILNRLEGWGDITHTNTIEIIEANYKNPLFKKGNIILSSLSLDLIYIIDPDKGVVWAESDLWSQQHQPTLLNNGRIIMLDNKGFKNQSRIIEFNPLTEKTHWVYGGRDTEPFYTPSCGSCQRLPNGNTLITESDRGRAFEVTHNKSIVWEYYNPHRAGENNELIATLYEIVRLKPDVVAKWLKI